jgi:hypothetical protein
VTSLLVSVLRRLVREDPGGVDLWVP